MATTEIPAQFSTILTDFVQDLKTTFPEWTAVFDSWWKTEEMFPHIADPKKKLVCFRKARDKSIRYVFQHCREKLPPLLFDILYQNADLFAIKQPKEAQFLLPKLDFVDLWNQPDLSDTTKENIWKYLQLLLFSVVGTLDDKSSFGEATKLFDAIHGEEFKSKLDETLEGMQALFDKMQSSAAADPSSAPAAEAGEEAAAAAEEKEGSPFNASAIFGNLEKHLTKLFDGKIGRFAKEITEEMSAELMGPDFMKEMQEFAESSAAGDGEGIPGSTAAPDMKKMFAKLMKNPNKLMSVIHKIAAKFGDKIKTGELNESEIMAETTEFMEGMKDIPGMGNLGDMFAAMGMGKVDAKATQAKMEQRAKIARTKERIKQRVERKHAAQLQQQWIAMQEASLASSAAQATTASSTAISDEELIRLFSTGEKGTKTPRKRGAAASNK